MSSRKLIVCKTCRSYRIAQVASPREGVLRFHCSRCGGDFDVSDVAAYAKHFPADLDRCSECDEHGVELLERNHRYDPAQPSDEITDLYQCSHCGQKSYRFVQLSADCLYD